MNKVVSIFILFIFLFSTIGVIASSYHCKMAMPANKSCCKTMDKGCCEKNLKLLKITDQFISSSFHILVKSAPDFSFAILFSFKESADRFYSQTAFLRDHAPPDSGLDLILLTRAFRI
ncbi:MAG: hypothetical protein ABIO46_12780 [Chitinophagales bacterium]